MKLSGAAAWVAIWKLCFSLIGLTERSLNKKLIVIKLKVSQPIISVLELVSRVYANYGLFLLIRKFG